jgi:hypothetical protein
VCAGQLGTGYVYFVHERWVVWVCPGGESRGQVLTWDLVASTNKSNQGDTFGGLGGLAQKSRDLHVAGIVCVCVLT